MFYEIGKYGGFLTIIVSWMAMVFPFLKMKKKMKIITISEAVVNTPLGTVVRAGVLICGIAQIFFSYFLFLNFVSLAAKLGVILYGVGSFSFVLCGIIDYHQSESKHMMLVETYYVLMTLGFILLSTELPLIPKVLSWALLVIPLYLYYIKVDLTKFELTTIALSNIFALSVYFYLGSLNFR